MTDKYRVGVSFELELEKEDWYAIDPDIVEWTDKYKLGVLKDMFDNNLELVMKNLQTGYKLSIKRK